MRRQQQLTAGPHRGNIINFCATEHEGTHLDDVAPCDANNEGTFPKWSAELENNEKGKDQEEVKGAQKEYDCLRANQDKYSKLKTAEARTKCTRCMQQRKVRLHNYARQHGGRLAGDQTAPGETPEQYGTPPGEARNHDRTSHLVIRAHRVDPP